MASSFVAGQTVFVQVVPALQGHESLALLIFAAIIIAYTFLGGFKAVCWTDFFQGLMMLVALLAVPLVILFFKRDFDPSKFGEVYTYIENGAAVECAFNPNPFAASWQDIITGLGWGLGYFGMPHIIVRFMSAKNSKVLKKSAVIGIIWVILTLGAAIAIAYLGRTIVGEELCSAGNQKLIFISLVRRYFPAFLGGILLAAIVAAAMSTADSQLLVASSSFTSDMYKPIFRKNASDKEVIWVGRIAVLIIAVVAYFIASSKGKGAQSIMNMVENAWGGFGSAFGPVIILSLFWKRFTYKGAVAGVAVGAIVDVVWLLKLTAVTGVYEIVPGFFCGLIAAVVVTLIDKKPSKEVEELFDRAVYAVEE